MGMFSFICKESGTGIESNGFEGEACYMFLLKSGKVVETMHGNYDAYGRVFDTVDHVGSFEWSMPWDEVCELMFNDKEGDGIAVIRASEYSRLPDTASDNDPNQGWGESGLVGGDYDNSAAKFKRVPLPLKWS